MWVRARLHGERATAPAALGRQLQQEVGLHRRAGQYPIVHRPAPGKLPHLLIHNLPEEVPLHAVPMPTKAGRVLGRLIVLWLEALGGQQMRRAKQLSGPCKLYPDKLSRVLDRHQLQVGRFQSCFCKQFHKLQHPL